MQALMTELRFDCRAGAIMIDDGEEEETWIHLPVQVDMRSESFRLKL